MIRWKQYIILITIMMYTGLSANSQPNLVLTKYGKRNHFYYQVGDRIRYMDKNSGRKISGVILIMNDSSIELAHAPRILLSDISCIYRTRHFFTQAAGAGIVVLGVYVPISILNRAFQHEKPLVNEDILYVNGPMLAISGISMILSTRKFKVGDKWNLKVMDFGHPVYD